MIQYKNVQKTSENRFSIEVLGGWDHDQESLERAVLEKAGELCASHAEILSSEMGEYFSGGAISGYAPKITSIVICEN